MRRRASPYYDDDEYYPFSWGSGDMFILSDTTPVKGFRRPIGFTADIDTPVEEWDHTKKPGKRKGLNDPL